MSIPYRVAKVTLSGEMFGGQEQWSTGFFLGWEDHDADPITQLGADNIRDAWQTFFQAPSTCITPQYEFKQVKLSMLNNDMSTMADSAVYSAPVTTSVGGLNANNYPPQIALVVSLRNSLPRGLATKGRMFIPGIAATIDGTGRINAGQLSSIANNAQTFFNSVYNDADLPGNPVLASNGRGPLLLDGNVRNVSSIRVGNVFDTQRRRRNALAESYLVKPVALG